MQAPSQAVKPATSVSTKPSQSVSASDSKPQVPQSKTIPSSVSSQTPSVPVQINAGAVFSAMQGQAVKPGTGVTPKPSQSVAVNNSKPALQASQFMPGPRLVSSQAPSYSSGQSTTSTPVVAPTYTLQGQAASVKPASPSLPVSKSSPGQYLDRAQASGLSTNVVTFLNLETYQQYFLDLLERKIALLQLEKAL